MSLIQSIFAFFLIPIVSLLIWLIIARVVISWLVAFNIMNLRNPFIAQIYYGVETFTEPIMRPFQRIIPPIGGLDISPIAALFFLQWLGHYLFPTIANSLG